MPFKLKASSQKTSTSQWFLVAMTTNSCGISSKSAFHLPSYKHFPRTNLCHSFLSCIILLSFPISKLFFSSGHSLNQSTFSALDPPNISHTPSCLYHTILAIILFPILSIWPNSSENTFINPFIHSLRNST